MLAFIINNFGFMDSNEVGRLPRRWQKVNFGHNVTFIFYSFCPLAPEVVHGYLPETYHAHYFSISNTNCSN